MKNSNSIPAHGYGLNNFLSDCLSHKKQTLSILFFSGALCFLMFYAGLPVFFLPDLVVLLFACWAIIHMRQAVSPLIWVSILFLIGYLCFSPPRSDIEFDNKFLITIKPFIYLIILYLTSGLQVAWNLRLFIYGFVVLYPVMLLWDILLWYVRDGFFMTRPNFIFENNFEVPLLLTCFVIIAFIYKDKDLRVFFLVSLSIFLTGSRSGLIGLLLIGFPYLLSLGKKQKLFGLFLLGAVLIYSFVVRGIPAFNTNSIDRVQTFYAMLSYYNHSWIDLMLEPFGVGIYQKVPSYICMPLAQFSEWFNGNSYNCDPIMFQSFMTRTLYQMGIITVLYVLGAFFWELRQKMGAFLALLVLAPVFSASLSVGGFSNGIAFLGIVLSLMAYQQTYAGG